MQDWSDIVGAWPNVPRSYNIAPSSQIAAFYVPLDGTGDDLLQGAAMRWGMIPAWTKEFDTKYATFNARLESVEQKPTFRNAWRTARRCVIPMAGYYEWRIDERGQKQAVYISEKDSAGLFAAGLYEPWHDRFSCTMLTREATDQLAAVHHRMPILLRREDLKIWLAHEPDDLGTLKQRLTEIACPNVVFWPVDRAVGNPLNNDSTLIKPIDLP